MTVSTSYFTSDLKRELNLSFPVITPAETGSDLNLWLIDNNLKTKAWLHQNGAVLFRGYDIQSADEFNAVVGDVFDEKIEYKKRTSPRTEVHKNIYTSTDHPSDQPIHMHTECSYANSWPQYIAFFCLIPPEQGGETPIADERLMLQYLRKSTIETFRRKKIKYVRNIMEGIGLSWQQVYQTNDKLEVEALLKQEGVEFEWRGENHLHVSWVRDAFYTHPVSKDLCWFNHMYFGNSQLYDPIVLEVIPEDELPFATYYGDGTTIEPSVIEEVTNAYELAKQQFSWQKSDLLLLDNMVYAHGRNPFEGDRKILVAMGNPIAKPHVTENVVC